MIPGALVALALAAAPPLECPAGAVRRGAPPPDDLAEWCEREDPLGRARRDGPARTWYDDGGLWLEERWKDGDRDGPSVERHRNGRKAREGAFAAGRKTGRWTTWLESGAVAEEATWRDGLLHGPFTTWHANGAKRAEGRYCGGVQCGVWRTWDEAGRELGAVEYGEASLVP